MPAENEYFAGMNGSPDIGRQPSFARYEEIQIVFIHRAVALFAVTIFRANGRKFIEECAGDPPSIMLRPSINLVAK